MWTVGWRLAGRPGGCRLCRPARAAPDEALEAALLHPEPRQVLGSFLAVQLIQLGFHLCRHHHHPAPLLLRLAAQRRHVAVGPGVSQVILRHVGGIHHGLGGQQVQAPYCSGTARDRWPGGRGPGQVATAGGRACWAAGPAGAHGMPAAGHARGSPTPRPARSHPPVPAPKPAPHKQRLHCRAHPPSSASSSLSATLRAGLFCSSAAMMRCRAPASTSFRLASSPLLPAACGGVAARARAGGVSAPAQCAPPARPQEAQRRRPAGQPARPAASRAATVRHSTRPRGARVPRSSTHGQPHPATTTTTTHTHHTHHPPTHPAPAPPTLGLLQPLQPLLNLRDVRQRQLKVDDVCGAGGAEAGGQAGMEAGRRGRGRQAGRRGGRQAGRQAGAGRRRHSAPPAPLRTGAAPLAARGPPHARRPAPAERRCPADVGRGSRPFSCTPPRGAWPPRRDPCPTRPAQPAQRSEGA